MREGDCRENSGMAAKMSNEERVSPQMFVRFLCMTMAAFLCPLSGFSEYPTMDRAMELFDANSVLATNVSMRSEVYRQFSEDLRCQTASENVRNMETFLINAVTSIVVTVSTNVVDDGTSAFVLCNRGYWYFDAAKTFQDFPTNPVNCMAVATYLGGVHKVYIRWSFRQTFCATVLALLCFSRPILRRWRRIMRNAGCGDPLMTCNSESGTLTRLWTNTEEICFPSATSASEDAAA